MLPVLFLAAALAFSGQPTSRVLEMTPEMVEYVESRVASGGPEAERLRQLVGAIFDEKGLGFVYEKSKTQTAAETFQTGKGNCLSFTNLFIAMARHVGLDAHYQEVDIPPSWDRQGQVIVSPQHINALVEIGGTAFEVDLAATIDRRLGARSISDNRGWAHYFNNLGVQKLGEGRPQEAVTLFRQALENDPMVAFVWNNLGSAQTALEQLSEAEQSYLQAIELKHRRQTVLDNLSRLYRRMGRHKEADRLARKVEKYRNKNPFYHFELGRAAFASGSIDQSILHFRKAIQRRPQDHMFHFALSRAYTEAGEFGKASGSLKKAEKLALNSDLQRRYSKKLELLEQRRPKRVAQKN